MGFAALYPSYKLDRPPQCAIAHNDRKKPAGLSPAGLIVQKPIRGSQYIRGDPPSIALTDAEIFRAGLAAHAVDLRFI
jgi:hypothetical protein